MIKATHKGNFEKFDSYMNRLKRSMRFTELDTYAQACVQNLKQATPKDSGLTAESWAYEITRDVESSHIIISNHNIQNGVNIALLLEYDHGTINGGFVSGKNYIAPAIQKTFMDIVDNTWKEMTR